MSQTEVQLIKNGAVVDADINGMSSSKLSGALPAISGASLTNLPTPAGKARNLVINGAMLVAQRGTSATAEGYKTVDRFTYDAGGEDETITQAQVDVASGTTPYTLGFRKAFRLTNGNQTGGADAGDYVQPQYRFEAQDIANSGWNYTSSSSFITLSFWVKSSVAGDYTFNFETLDGTAYRYLMEYTLSADTWTKVTKTIPGNSNLTFNNDNGHGATIMLYPFLGSNYVQADQENNWYASSNNKFGTTSTTSWYTTNDATWEITGLQVEVGSVATDFEHLSYPDDLRRCQRYYYKLLPTNGAYFGAGAWYNSNTFMLHVDFPVFMRTNVTSVETTGTASHYRIITNATTVTCSAAPSALGDPNTTSLAVNFPTSGAGTQGQGGLSRSGNAAAFLAFSAEL